jgi:hypothetical protein
VNALVKDVVTARIPGGNRTHLPDLGEPRHQLGAAGFPTVSCRPPRNSVLNPC